MKSSAAWIRSGLDVKEHHQPLDCLPESARSCVLPCHHQERVKDQLVNHHVKYGREYRILMGDPLVALERGAVIVPCSVHN